MYAEEQRGMEVAEKIRVGRSVVDAIALPFGFTKLESPSALRLCESIPRSTCHGNDSTDSAIVSASSSAPTSTDRKAASRRNQVAWRFA